METHEVRLFPDIPIAGMQGKKEATFITLNYEFDNFTVSVENVFAWRDSETLEEFVPSDIAVFVGDEVRRFASVIEQFRAAKRDQPTNIREYAIRLPPPAMDVPA